MKMEVKIPSTTSGNIYIYRRGIFTIVLTASKNKGKGQPITGHEGPAGEQMYSSTLPSSSALDRGGWPTPRPARFTPGKDPVPTV